MKYVAILFCIIVNKWSKRAVVLYTISYTILIIYIQVASKHTVLSVVVTLIYSQTCFSL